MTTEQNAIHKLVYSELTQLINETKQKRKSKNRTASRSSKYGNTLSPQQLPSPTSTNSGRPKSAVQSQNHIALTSDAQSTRKTKTVELIQSPSLPSLTPLPQRASYTNVTKLDSITRNQPSSNWNANTPLEKMVEKEVSRRLDDHLSQITENTHKLYLDSRDEMQAMTKQLHNALEQVHHTKREYEARSNELTELISLLRDQQHNSNSLRNESINESTASSITFDTDTKTEVSSNSRLSLQTETKSKQHKNHARARSASERVRGNKASKRPMTAALPSNSRQTLVAKTRPELTKVSMYSSFNEHRVSPLSVAVAGLDQIIFEIESNVAIRRPMIKLWPKLSSFKVNRLNPDIVHIGKNARSWIVTCKLHPNSPVGPVPFVINYQSQDNVCGNTIHKTTDETFCVVNSADDIIEVTKEHRQSKRESKNKRSTSKKHKTKTPKSGTHKVHKKHASTEKKLSKKVSMKTLRARDRPVTPAPHVQHKNKHKMNRKASKKTFSRHKRQHKSTTNLSRTVKGREYDNAMERYANSLLANQQAEQW